MTGTLLALVLAGAPTAAAAAAAGATPADLTTTSVAPPPATASSSTSTRIGWHVDNRNQRQDDDDFGIAIIRTNLALDGGDSRFAVRIDGETFVRDPARRVASGITRQDDLRLERVNLDLERGTDWGGITVRGHLALGDFYTQLGRGLVLSLRRLDELGIDSALRGVRADLSVGDGALELHLLAGTVNVVNLEPQLLAHVDDPRDRIGGVRIEGRIGGLDLGAHVVAFRDAVAPAPGATRESEAAGATADLVLGDTLLGIEVDAQRRRTLGSQEDGWAAYGTFSAPLGDRLTLLAEGKHYVRFAHLTGSPLSSGEGRFVYNQAPTAERIDQELLDNTDVTGGRLRGDVLLGEAASSVHGSLGGFRNRSTQQWLGHGFVGLDLRAQDGLTVATSAGYRREWTVAGGALTRAIAHGELDVLTPVSARLSLHFIARHESHVEANAGTRYIFHRGGASLEVALFDWLVIGAGTDWDTQDQNDGIARHFGFGLVRWRASDAFIAQVLAGSQRGGIRCIAGACRMQAPFAGVRTDVTVLY